MDSLSLILGLACVVSALAIAGLAIPLVQGRVAPNAWYGMRLPEAFASDEAWYRINRYGGKQFILWSIPIFVIGVATLFVGLDEQPLLAMVPGLAPLLVLGAAVQTFRYASRTSEEA